MPEIAGSDPGRQYLSCAVPGVQDYIGKNHFPGVLLAYPVALTLPDPCSGRGCAGCRQGSRCDDAIALYGANQQDDAREMADILGVRYDVLDIQPTFAALLDTLNRCLRGCH